MNPSRRGGPLVVFTATSLVFGVSAQAAEITDRTTCTEMVRAFDTENLGEVRQFAPYVMQSMETFDRQHSEQGEPRVMAMLSEEGRTNMVPSTSVHCRNHPEMTE